MNRDAGQVSGMDGPYRLDRTLMRVSGPDAIGFLDNLLTQDVTRLAEDGALYSALLSPQGKIIADMFLWRDGDDGIVIDADSLRGAALLQRLTMYKLRAQVQIDDVSADRVVLWAPSSAALPDGLPDPRFPPGELGWRAIAAVDASASRPAGDIALNTHRLSLGVPDLAQDAAPEEVFALEALLEELNGVDFQKGCFVGQENVSRMKRRATTRKKFCPIVFEGEAPAPGTPVVAGDAQLGSVRSGGPGRALALLRLDRALEAVDQGRALTAADRPVRLHLPSWLILPQGEDAAGASD